MPIPFRDAEAIEELGAAAYMHLVCLSDEPVNWVGCIFIINARGEPLEFVFNRVELVASALWRAGDATLGAARRLLTSLLAATVLTPRLLFITESPATDEIFGPNRSIWSEIPDIRVRLPAPDPSGVRRGSAQPAMVIWGSRPPDSEASRLFDLVSSRGLLFEPFERANTGLREVYPEWAKLIH